MSYKEPNKIIRTESTYIIHEWNIMKCFAIRIKYKRHDCWLVFRKYRTLSDAIKAKKDILSNSAYKPEYLDYDQIDICKIDYSNIKEKASCYLETQPKYYVIDLRKNKLKRILK